jgi:two-component system KDP operon response regulator KdpE
VLVVDDERPIRRFLHSALVAADMEVAEAESGEAGLLAAAAFRPDVIVLDLGLPDLDGVEVIRRLREWNRQPIVVLSVRDREGDKVEASIKPTTT